MNFDFALLLTALTLLTGVVWLIDALFFARQRHRAAEAAPSDEARAEALRPTATVEYSKSFFPVLLIVLVFRSFVFEPFRIPSGSMLPNLLIGDFIVVNKYAYGLRLPVLNTKILDVGEPQRGDVVVFRKPAQPGLATDPQAGTTFVKRLVGVPGDRVRYVRHQLYINDQPVPYAPIGSGKYVADASNALMPNGRPTAGELLFREELPGKPHSILQTANPFPELQMPNELTLGPGEYFMLGDNRDNSSDGRAFGVVREQDLVGKVTYIWFHFDFERDGYVAWRRIGKRVE